MKKLQQLEFEALRRLTGVDCDTPKCYANAVGTGVVVLSGSVGFQNWYMEFYCPDCRTTHSIGSPVIEALMQEVMGAPAHEREAIVARWVASRDSCQPWSNR